VLAIMVAIGLAVCGLGYWGLVLRPIVSAACMLTGAWILCSWRPGRPTFDSEVKKLIRFGMHVVGFTLTYSAGKSADRFALGLRYLPREVGLYQNALNLYDNSICAVLNPLHAVGSAALSKLQATPELLKGKYLAALSALAFYMMPASAILSVLSVDLIVILLGEKWRGAGSLLGILALRGMFHVIEGSQGWLHLSTGRADRWMNWGIITTIVQVVAIIVGLPFGAKGVSIAFVVSGCLIAFPSISYAGRTVGIGLREVIQAVGRQLFGALITVGIGWWLRARYLENLPSLYRFALLGALCVAIYLVIVVLFFRVTDPLRIGVRLVLEHLPADPLRKRKHLGAGHNSVQAMPVAEVESIAKEPSVH
jgi:PST family polysaccharide transporter